MNQLIFAFLLLVIISPYFSKFSSIMISRADLGIVAPEGSYEYVIHKLTSKEDRLFVNTLDNTLYISTNRLPATRDACGGITPWTYEMFGSTVIPDLNTYKPKIAIFKEGYDVWGYKNTTTQPEVVNYVKNNYTQLNIYNLDSLYIRNDYYSDAIHILNTK